MKIRLKKQTKEGLQDHLPMFYYGIPFLLFIQSGFGYLLGAKEFLFLDTVEVLQVTGTIVFLQWGWYLRKSIFYWFKDWKKRNVKNGVLEI